jgi:hypothetical protein
VDECPEGYSQVATFQSSDDNFLLYRGFGYLHCRVLSSLQHDVERLEKKLDDMDQWDKTHGDECKLQSQRRDQVDSKREKANGTFPEQFDKTRPELIAEIKAKLMEYGK